MAAAAALTMAKRASETAAAQCQDQAVSIPPILTPFIQSRENTFKTALMLKKNCNYSVYLVLDPVLTEKMEW